MAENAVGLKLPTFWTQNPAAWFAQAEAQFAIRNITQDQTKYYHTLMSLDGQTATLAESIVLQPPDQQKYTTLKDFLVQSFGISEEERGERLLSIGELGDRKPSELMNTILHLNGLKPHHFILRNIFLRALPGGLRQSVATCKEQDLRKLAIEADRLATSAERHTSYAAAAEVEAVRRDGAKKKRVLCYYHRRFGTASRRCQQPCSWIPGKEEAGSR